MFVFDLAKPTRSKQISEMAPGTLFLHQQGGLHLAICVSDPPCKRAAWFNLTGPREFQFEEESKFGNAGVPLIDASRMRLTIDESSRVDNNDFTNGLLVIDGNGNTCIAGTWVGLEEKGYQNFLILGKDKWTIEQLDVRFLSFASWSLGYVDEFGKWIEVVSHKP